MLIRLIEEDHYPFDPETEAELQQYRQELQLTDEEVAAITTPILEAAEEEHQIKLQQQRQREQQEYENKRQRYQQEFRQAIEPQYPIGSSTRDRLQQLQRSLGLSDEEVRVIETPILAAAEADYQEKLRQRDQQEYEQKLNRYEQEFRKAIEAQYPINSFVRDGLKDFQRSLKLSTEDIDRIEMAIKQKAYQSQLQVFEFQVPTVVENGHITYQQGQANYFVEDLGNGITLETVDIAGGAFLMGSTESASEKPPHRVMVSFCLMGKFAVTQAQWKVVAALPRVKRGLDPDPSHFKGARRPVEQISWHEAVEFCDRLSRKTGRQYRLPSEAEWEYACRARTTTPFYCGETITTDLANYNGNYTYGSGIKGVYREQTTDVGSSPPNAFGLYDMHGNVWEWCADHWHENYQGAPSDGSVWVTGGDSDRRLLRGGSWYSNPRNCRSAYRLRFVPDNKYDYISFRVVCAAAWTH